MILLKIILIALYVIMVRPLHIGIVRHCIPKEENPKGVIMSIIRHILVAIVTPLIVAMILARILFEKGSESMDKDDDK